jgi:hypothetical protein
MIKVLYYVIALKYYNYDNVQQPDEARLRIHLKVEKNLQKILNRPNCK